MQTMGRAYSDLGIYAESESLQGFPVVGGDRLARVQREALDETAERLAPGRCRLDPRQGRRAVSSHWRVA